MRRWLPGLRGWIALCGTAATLLLVALLWDSRFVTARRAVFHLDRARAHLASHELPQARAEFRASLRLQPEGVEARRELAAMELGLGNWELAFLELESLAELHPEDRESWIALVGFPKQHIRRLESRIQESFANRAGPPVESSTATDYAAIHQVTGKLYVT